MADICQHKARRYALQASVARPVFAPFVSIGFYVINGTPDDVRVGDADDPTVATNYFIVTAGIDWPLVIPGKNYYPGIVAFHLLANAAGTVTVIWI
jgi:hypothetical protein